MRWLDGFTDSMDMTLSKLWETVKNKGSLECCSLWSHKESDMTWQLKNNNSFIQVVEVSFLFCEKCLGILKVTAMNE